MKISPYIALNKNVFKKKLVFIFIMTIVFFKKIHAYTGFFELVRKKSILKNIKNVLDLKIMLHPVLFLNLINYNKN